jgi:hypothetical protein
MLLSLDTGKIITVIPHKREFNIWKNRLTEEEYFSLINVLTEKINSNEIHTSSWMPGTDWNNTPFQIIYEKACEENKEHSAMFFGLILWDVIMRHSECWAFGHYNFKNGLEIKGTTYFKVKKPENNFV